jgi:hypothetical protein
VKHPHVLAVGVLEVPCVRACCAVGVVVSGKQHGLCLARPACSLHGMGMLSALSLASCVAPLVHVRDNKVVVSKGCRWQPCECAGECTHARCTLHGRCAPTIYMVSRGPGRAMFPSPLDPDINGLVPALLVPPHIPSFVPDIGHWAGFGIDMARWVWDVVVRSRLHC